MPYDNRLTGILSRNQRKRPDKKDPDFTGQCEMEDGKKYWLSGWIKESGPQSKTPGKKFFSLSFTAQEAAKTETAKPAPAAEPAAQNIDEDVPF